jgi:cytochrome P450
VTFRRTATSDCELGGQRIGEGDQVVVCFISANRDDMMFADPGPFDHAHYTGSPGSLNVSPADLR